MKGFKRITSIVLALAMVVTSIAISGPVTVKADNATDNWKANGIVSPKHRLRRPPVACFRRYTP